MEGILGWNHRTCFASTAPALKRANIEFSCRPDSPIAEPSDRSATAPASKHRRTQAVNCNDLLGFSRPLAATLFPDFPIQTSCLGRGSCSVKPFNPVDNLIRSFTLAEATFLESDYTQAPREALHHRHPWKTLPSRIEKNTSAPRNQVMIRLFVHLQTEGSACR